MRRPALPWTLLFVATLWGWAIWACAEHWEGNPNYSYGWVVPVLALFFGIRRYLSLRSEAPAPSPAGWPGWPILALAAAALGLVIFFLEYRREQMWHQEIVLWAICLLAAGATLATLWREGGLPLARAQTFPVLFFLTAVPWPPRLEQPITSGLMQGVAAWTTEILHWLGIEAQASGGAIALHGGLVGITEACSGIRSLQAGVMFGLAIGEWFLLRPARRIFLLGLAIVLALATNLTRTMILALQAERHGPASIDRIHDLVGNIMVTTLILGIWIAGKLLAKRAAEDGLTQWGARLARLRQNPFAPAPAWMSGLALAALLGIFSAHLVYGRLEASQPGQTRARFVVRLENGSGNQAAPVPREIWNELRPTSGEYVRRESTDSPGASAACYHFFWKPSIWNRFALVHRPDVCMPGIGWQPAGSAESLEVELDGRPVRFYLFRFRRGDTHALELWGAWRNGELVTLDLNDAQIFGTLPPPTELSLEGKRGSATEIVACSLIRGGAEPDREMAVALLRAVFHYRSDDE